MKIIKTPVAIAPGASASTFNPKLGYTFRRVVLSSGFYSRLRCTSLEGGAQ